MPPPAIATSSVMFFRSPDRTRRTVRRRRRCVRRPPSAARPFCRCWKPVRSCSLARAPRNRPLCQRRAFRASSRRSKTTHCRWCRGAGPFAVWRFFGAAQFQAGDGRAVEQPLQTDEWVVRHHAVRVGARADVHADFQACLNRRRPPRERDAFIFDELLALEIHRVLHGQPTPSLCIRRRFTSPASLRWSTIQCSCRSESRRSRVRRSSAACRQPHRDSSARAARSPARCPPGHLEELLLLRRRRVIVVVQPGVTISPMPLKCSMRSPKPIGKNCVAAWKSASSVPA